MKLIKSFKMALNMVLHSKLRSWLTILGIVIGVASVIAILSIGDGMEAEVSSQFDSSGADIITLTPGYTKATDFGPGRHDEPQTSSADADADELTRRDYLAVKSVSDVEAVNTLVSDKVDVYYQGEEGTLSVTGVDESVYAQFETNDLLEGRYLSSADYNVVVIGETLANEFFDRELGINQLLTIEGKSFRVVGILDGGRSSIYMPLDAAYTIFDDKEKDVYDSMQIKIRDEDRLNETEAKLNLKLMNSRHVSDDDLDFTLTTNAASADLRAEMLSTITTFLTAIAGVSLVVGAVGVANTMFTSVLEKTKEIGIMKAIGARNSDILAIFIFNSALIGLVGGIIGAIIGIGLSLLLGLAGMPALVSYSNVFMILGLSVFIGMISGVIPAVGASKLSPVDALRAD
ncbi:MAG: ABC transporter permease [Candidatus Woesearchaeota archaeon]|jgi:putative ABC transport system permease protein|nr:ABC transporter permease [Candidatus Woesearchaeota archaeon]